MNSARRFLFGMAVGAAAIGLAAHAHGDSLDGSTQALILGPTGTPTPDAAYISTAESVYLDPSGFDGTAMALTTPETSDFGPSVTAGEADLVNAMEADYNAGDLSAADPLTIMTYSQSSVVASLAEQQLADYGIPSEDLRFLMVGDTSSAMGGFLNTWGETPMGEQIITWLGWSNLIGATTPDNLYPTAVYTIPGDGWADWDNGANWLGMFSTHDAYFGLTPDEIASATLSNVDGLTDYYTVDPGNIFETLITAAMNVGDL